MFPGRKRNIGRNLKNRILFSDLPLFIISCLLLLLLVEGFFFLEKRLRPAILSLAEIQANILATYAVNNAILEQVANNFSYHDLITLTQDEQDKIIMAQVNTMEVNRLMAETTLATQEAFQEMGQVTVGIPLGELFDHYLLATYGPKIPVKLIPAGRVNTCLLDSFEEAGINQVRHKLYLAITTEIRIVIPFVVSKLEVQTTVPLADAIYPGSVPETLINLNIKELTPGLWPDPWP